MSEATRRPTKKDFASDQEVRWCPGCGDYAILNALLQSYAELGVPREKIVVVSGIGCAARIPYYVDTYGFHTIHGRAPAIASGLEIARPDLHVWVMGGDGDMLSIGGNHLLHALRRNVNIKILCFNNRIYGLTKGQTSPTSEFGKRTYSTPMGSLDRPVHPVSVARAAEATFIARSVDIFNVHLRETIRRAAAHEGSAFVEILQNCVIFNDGAFDHVTGRDNRLENVLYLEQGEPMVFGRERDKGIRAAGLVPEVVRLGENGVTKDDLLVHDESNEAQSYMLSRMEPGLFPTPVGVLRRQEFDSYERGVHDQLDEARRTRGEGDLMELIHSGDVWEVE